jgi:hypothetical protein
MAGLPVGKSVGDSYQGESLAVEVKLAVFWHLSVFKKQPF